MSILTRRVTYALWRHWLPTRCLSSRTTMTSTRIPEEDAYYVFSHMFKKRIQGLTRKGCCVLQSISFGALSDVTAVLRTRPKYIQKPPHLLCYCMLTIDWAANWLCSSRSSVAIEADVPISVWFTRNSCWLCSNQSVIWNQSNRNIVYEYIFHTWIFYIFFLVILRIL